MKEHVESKASEPGAARAGALGSLAGSLRRVGRAARRRLVFQALGTIAAIGVAAVTFGGFADYLLRLPSAIRIGFLAVASLALVMALKRLVPPAWRFRPTLTELALRLERSPEGRRAGLEGIVAAGLEFDRAGAPAGVSGELETAAIARAAAMARGIHPRRALLQADRTLRVGMYVLAALLPLLGMSLASPSLTRIGLARILTPWADVAWPKRTEVMDAVASRTHAIGTALPLRAWLVRTPHEVGASEVRVTYRVLVNGTGSAPRRDVLTSQGRRGVRAGEDAAEGELFERLLDSASLAPPERSAADRIELEYWFASDDDETSPARVLLVDPPAIASATLTVTPPGYAGTLDPDSPFVHGAREIGRATDERSSVGPILAGSRVVVELDLNKPLPSPDAADADAVRRAIEARFPGLPTEGVAAAFEPARWRLGWEVRATTRVPIVLEDEHGIRARDEMGLRLAVVEDRPPTTSIVEPAQDEAVLPTAVVDVEGEGRDDVALASLVIRTQRAVPPADSVGAAPEPAGDPRTLTEAPNGTLGRSTRIRERLALAPLELKPGQEVWLTAVATDAYEWNGTRHDPAISPVRRLRVISESEFVEQVRAELSGVREAARRLEQDQAKLIQARPGAMESATQASAQAGRQEAIRDRVAPLDDSVRRLSSRLERNRLEDRQLRGILDDALGAIQEASSSADRASKSLARLGDPRTPQAEREAEAPRLEEAQKKADDALTDLASMLDAGTDSWAVRRSLEKLLNEQQQVSRQTSNAGEETRGKSEAELSAAQREDLERLAARQADLSQRAASAIETLEQRAKQLSSSDAGQSQSMKQAAQRGREQEIEQKLREASKAIRENKTNTAESLQQEASRAMEQMLEDLDRVEQQRDQALRRLLADLADSLGQLVRQQERELGVLAKGMAATPTNPEALKGLDVGMARLNRDTLALADRVEDELREAEHVGDLLAAAARAQGSAVSALKQDPADGLEADGHERTSLARLREALDEANRLQQKAEERDEDRKRAELLKAYRAALEAQTAINAETQPLVGKDLSRRDRNAARALGTRQRELAESLAAILKDKPEVATNRLFKFSHDRLDASMGSASRELSEGNAPARVSRDQATALATLRSLVDALKDAQKKSDEFREGAGGSRGGGSPGGGQPQGLFPPIAELKLLRELQVEAAAITRAAADAGGDGLDDAAAMQGELSSMARDLIRRLQNPDEEPGTPKGGAQ